MNKLEELLTYQNAIANIQSTINILKWELRIIASKKSAEDLIKLISYYENKLFILQTSSHYRDLLRNVIQDKSFEELEESEQRYIYHMLKHYNEYEKVPTSFYTKYAELKNKANVIWRTAKEQNNYELFKPYLEQIIEMTKQYYAFIDSSASNLYDVMLNNYENGLTTTQIDKLFTELKKRLLPLIPTEVNKEESTLKMDCTEKELIDCANFLLDYIGFDIEKGTLGIYPHGYTEKMNKNDIRIAFQHTEDPINFVTTIIHEGGHGIFEQNIKENLSNYENVTIENLYALHESQSRFYENILGRNRNFWIPIYDEIKERLHINTSLDTFVEMMNNPVPSLIRTEADELTYCMHIILRYEIERDLFNEKIKVEEIPEIWNNKMKEYLHVTVDTPSHGLMQDVHWSEGGFGYFPSYLLGTIYDGMFLKAIERDLGCIDDILKEGNIKRITEYLIKNIYQYGGAYTSLEVIKKVCREEISADPIAEYFDNKYRKKKRTF